MNDRSPCVIANAIRMKRVQHKGPFLIVEGSSDARFYKMFINHKACRVVPANSKEAVLQVVSSLESEVEGILGIVDADFWKVDGIEPPSSNVIMTDTHDLESLILSSSALNKVLAEYGNDREIDDFEYRTGHTIQEVLAESGKIIGFCRWISLTNRFSLKFSHLNFGKFIEGRDLSVDIDLFFKALRKNSSFDVPVKSMKRTLKTAINAPHDPWQLTCGHDMVSILLIGLKYRFGENNAEKLVRGSLESDLRLSYSEENFRKTQMHAAIQQWESKNPSYPILPTE